MLGAVVLVALFGEQALAETGALDRLEVLLRDHHVGVDVDLMQGRGDALEDSELFHGSRTPAGRSGGAFSQGGRPRSIPPGSALPCAAATDVASLSAARRRPMSPARRGSEDRHSARTKRRPHKAAAASP